MGSSSLVRFAAKVSGHMRVESESRPAPAQPDPESLPQAGDRWRLLLLSFLMLFVELALIRWTGSNVVYLSYFSNFVLLGSFLGIGIGFLRARARVHLFAWAPLALTLLVAFVLLFPVEINRRGEEIIYFGSTTTTGLPVWVTLPVVFVAVAGVLTMIAEGVARTFARFDPLEAYRLDIAGSILGIAAFSALSLFRAPPVVWGLVAAGLFAVLVPPRTRMWQVVPLLALVGLLAFETVQPNESWSPYYKVTAVSGFDGTEPLTLVEVNGIPHQAIQSSQRRLGREPIYFQVYERIQDNPLEEVLVVGAGNGSDVAIALQMGAEHVDAVEIDPRLYELGAQLHPDRPYDDPRVTVHIDDGRAFLERTDRRYDLILFALPDSLTLVSGQSSLRLESYLFTEEALREAREHLAPGGAFAMYNYYREPWLIDRLAQTLTVAHGRPPCLDRVEGTAGLALLTASPDPAAVACAAVWQPLTADVPAPVDDNYPFLYLREPGLPGLYVVAIALILAASLVFVRAAAGPLRRMAAYLDLFFMGSAFLLLETKSVVQFALLFGTTWFVNALVFGGVLVAVLAAVEVARHVTFRRPAWLYAALLAALAVAWVVPEAALLQLSFWPRFALAVLVAFTPIFLANLVFAARFKSVGASTVAFGANLLGAMVGGLLEYSALVVGYRALLVAAALLYGLAFLFGRRYLGLQAST
jgi:SAM-dependent methyltransferase